MALALERGSQMQAPLGLAVIGGLVMSTFATLLVLPSIFAVVIGRSVARSPSIYPEDPDSTYYDPLFHSVGAIENKVKAEASQPLPFHPQPDEHNGAADGVHESVQATDATLELTSFPGDL
jgi:hypothetical protein